MVLTQCDSCPARCRGLNPSGGKYHVPLQPQNLTRSNRTSSAQTEIEGTVLAWPVCVLLCLLNKLGEIVSEGVMCVVYCGFDGYLVLEGVEENELVALEWMSLLLSS